MPALSRRAITASAFAMLLSCAGAAHSAGLGKAKVLSAAGEPLRVRIELILGPGDRPGRIRAAVASPSVPEDDAGNQLSVTVDPAPYGRAALTVRSSAPMEDTPFELFVAVSSPAGRAQRSFNLAPRRPQTAPAPGAPAAPSPAPEPVPASGTMPLEEAAVPPVSTPPAPAAAAPPPKPATGDSLGRLAGQAAMGKRVSAVALGVALLAALGAVALLVFRR
jgi:Tfp pilus assembly protein FimV